MNKNLYLILIGSLLFVFALMSKKKKIVRKYRRRYARYSRYGYRRARNIYKRYRSRR